MSIPPSKTLLIVPSEWNVRVKSMLRFSIVIFVQFSRLKGVDKTGEEQVGPVAVDREIIDTVELECYAFQALVVVGDELVFLYRFVGAQPQFSSRKHQF